jgi:hypothetical protein
MQTMNSRRSTYILSFGMIAIIITACSFKSVYNRLDYLIPSYVEGMVSLDDVLEEKVMQRAQLMVNWHRNTQLKQYAQLLRTFQQDAGPQLNEERVLQHIATMESFWHTLSIRIDEEMAGLLPLLDEDQRHELFESITSKNEDFREEYVVIDEEERIDKYTENMIDTYESWLGDITDIQQRDIEKAAPGIQSSASLRLQQRRSWQNSIQKILQSSDETEVKSNRLREFFQDFSGHNAELETITESNKRVIAQLTVQIFHSLSADQKQHFIDKTDEYIRIFTELAEER